MLGVEQAGLAEIIEFILKKYPPDIQNNLVQVTVEIGLLREMKTRDWCCVEPGQKIIWISELEFE